MQLSTRVLLLLTVIFVVGLALILWGNDAALAAKRIFAATPNAQGELTIIATDYDFTPEVVRVKAGQQIKLTIRNEGLHTHEFMVGKQVHVENDVTEPPTPDFFEGLQVEVTGSGMPMGFAGMEEMAMDGMDMGNGDGMDMGADEHAGDDEHADAEDEHADSEMNMEEEQEHADEADHMDDDDHASEDVMGDEHDEDMAMEEEHAEGEMEMDMSGDNDAGMEMEMDEGAKVVLEGAHTEPMEMGHGDHHGGMVMVDPGQESTIILTIPEDKVGVWTFGCFQEEGLHFDDGMRGTLIVER